MTCSSCKDSELQDWQDQTIHSSKQMMISQGMQGHSFETIQQQNQHKRQRKDPSIQEL